jgi:lipopolysaccharide transport system permease protein
VIVEQVESVSPTTERTQIRQDPIGELWRYRELLYFFAWRDIKVRYRQAILGAAWAVIQPLFNMILFAVIFGRLAHMPSNGIPYPIFSYSGLVPWTYFAAVIGVASSSLTNNASLITKVYFPRVLLPFGTAVAGLLDFAVASLLLVGMMFYYHVSPSWRLLLCPFSILLMVLLTAGVSMFLSAMNVRYRDVKYVLPFMIQIWMFATPIIYPVSIVPPQYQLLMALNPCWGMVDSFRACLFPGQPVNIALIATSSCITLVIFISGYAYFRWMQKSFADII